ncbi:MAG: tRNA 4-thiouridine(8) synthase ThiI, partial [Bacilli bacterium]|nr:tRNA 4-thiouridine(8) synthase ThiI [Bacilli bacterium]
IKYGELTTKGDNINYFIKALKDNIESSLEGIDNSIKYDKGRMYVYTTDFDTALDKLKHTFGIHEINIGYEIETIDIEEIGTNILELLKDKEFNTFKVESKRSDKEYPLTSMEISRKLGGIILKNIDNIKVDVHNPEVLINVEVRFGKSLIYFDKVKGCGGYPVGTLGKGMLMLSGGIDSPVAGYLAMKRGIRIEAIYFDAPPHTSEAAKNKVLELAKILSNYSGYIKVHVINFTKIQEEILKNCPHDYLITLMRRYMYRIAERVARGVNAKAIVNGESIGQVASQTLTSMGAIETVVDIPVIRPVACLDKLDIIDIANKINTYETSILPYEDCCTIFVPDHPVINPTKENCEEYEKLYDFDTLVNEAIKNHTVIKVTPNKDETFNDIL